jgi:hypothetical protein
MTSDLVYPQQFVHYITLVENEDLSTILKNQEQQAVAFFNSIPEEKQLYKYAEGKWSVKEVLQHMIDTERVFSFRALAFSRKDPNTFPSFDENNYTKNSNANNRDWKDLVEEFFAVRRSTEYLFNSFSDEQLNTVGKASNYEMSVKAAWYMVAGHVKHHLNILKERYFNS